MSFFVVNLRIIGGYGTLRKLQRIILAAETQSAWIRKAKGFQSTAPLNQLRHNLPPPSEVADLVSEISRSAAQLGIDFDFITIDSVSDAIERLKPLISEQSLFWIISDGRIFHCSAWICSWLAMSGAIYFGADTTLQSITDNKYIMSSILKEHEIKVPYSALYRGQERVAYIGDPKKSEYSAYFVKPNCLGSQIGINMGSSTSSLKDAVDISRKIYKDYNVEAIVQEFIPGYDIRIALIDGESGSFQHHPSCITVSTRKGERLSFSVNREVSDREWYRSDLPDGSERILTFCQNVVDQSCKLGFIRDYAAIDVRVDEKGNPYFLECNLKPFVDTVSFSPLAKLLGFNSVGDLFISAILRRYNKSVIAWDAGHRMRFS